MNNKLKFDNLEIAFADKSDKDLLFSELIFRLLSSKFLNTTLISLTKVALYLRLPISPLVKKTIFKQFCGGESINESLQVAKKLGDSGIGSILDYSIEGENNEMHFEHTKTELLKIIKIAKENPHIPVTCIKITGIGKSRILDKKSNAIALNDKEQIEYERMTSRLDEICKCSFDNNVPIYIDAEESWIQPEIDRLAEHMMSKYNKVRAIVFTTTQMYRWDRLEYLKYLINDARAKNYKLGVKIVRGAYLEKENLRAKENDYRTPMQPNKKSTDNDYNLAIELAIKNIDIVEVCAGTHNENSCRILTELLQQNELKNNHPHVYFSQLYGMSDHISYNLSHKGYNVSKYLPYGPIKSTIPYLIRRAAENTAISGQLGKELKFILLEKKRRKRNKS